MSDRAPHPAVRRGRGQPGGGDPGEEPHTAPDLDPLRTVSKARRKAAAGPYPKLGDAMC